MAGVSDLCYSGVTIEPLDRVWLAESPAFPHVHRTKWLQQPREWLFLALDNWLPLDRCPKPARTHSLQPVSFQHPRPKSD